MIKINLLADRHAKEKIIIQQQVVVGLVTIVSSLVLCGFWWQAKASQIDDTNEKISGAKKELAVQKRVRNQVKDMEARERRLGVILKTIDFLVELKGGPTVYFDNLNVLLPPEIWLTKLSDIGGVISVEGYSFSNTAVAKLMRGMQSSEHFKRVELSGITSAKVKTETLKKFKVSSMTPIALKRAEEKAKREAAAKKKNKKKR